MQNKDKLLEVVYHKSGLMPQSKRQNNSRQALGRIHSKSILNNL